MPLSSQINVPLSQLTTMRLGGPAEQVITVHTKEDLVDAVVTAEAMGVPFFVLGDGSNVIATDDGFSGIIIVNRIKHFEIISHDIDMTRILVGAGENWDDVVARTVEMNLSGIEAMSAIPGTAGATPVQNVGAYGQEIADTLIELEAYDTVEKRFVTLSKDECHFSYRNSIFKDPTTRRHIIVSITLSLCGKSMTPPFYGSLQTYFDTHHIVDFSPRSIRHAVQEIRAVKLPDPSKIANTGSFFKNPIVDTEIAQKLTLEFPDMPTFPMKDGRTKIAAGWLIEQAGLKGFSAYGMKTYERNALVLVNEAAKSHQDLARFRDEVAAKVKQRFGISLEQEPETLQA